MDARKFFRVCLPWALRIRALGARWRHRTRCGMCRPSTYVHFLALTHLVLGKSLIVKRVVWSNLKTISWQCMGLRWSERSDFRLWCSSLVFWSPLEIHIESAICWWLFWGLFAIWICVVAYHGDSVHWQFACLGSILSKTYTVLIAIWSRGCRCWAGIFLYSLGTQWLSVHFRKIRKNMGFSISCTCSILPFFSLCLEAAIKLSYIISRKLHYLLCLNDPMNIFGSHKTSNWNTTFLYHTPSFYKEPFHYVMN